MKENENKRSNARSSLLKSGCYAAFYTLNGYFLKVKPALAIDKVVFSFVKKGTSGSGFDIYVDVDKFDLLCDSILDKELQNKLKNSNLQAPAWNHTTGEKGNKSLKIFQGNNGIVINGYVKDKKLTGNVPVGHDDLCIMAKWHRRVSAIYFEQMAQECINAMKSSEKFFEQNTDAEIEDISEPNSPTENEAVTQDPPKNPNEIFAVIKTSTTTQEYGNCGNFCFKGYTKNNQECIFVVPKDNIHSSIGEARWESFLKCTQKSSGYTFCIGYVKCKERLLVTSIKSVADTP